MSRTDLTEAQREALLASADRHEAAAGKVLAIAEQLSGAGYQVHSKKLRACVEGMIRFVDEARDVARSAESDDKPTLRVGARVRHIGRAGSYGEGKITATIADNEWVVLFDDGKQRELYGWALEVIA